MITFITSMVFLVPFLIIAGVVMIIALECQREGIASTFFSLAIVAVLYAHGTEIWSFITENAATSIYFAIGYIILGLVWSFIRWNEKVKGIFRKFVKLRDNFNEKNTGVELTTEQYQKEFNKTLEYQFKKGNGGFITIFTTQTQKEVIENITPKGVNHKALIVSWISYWPLSVIGTLLNNPFRRFFEFIYESVSGFYDEIVKRQKANILK